MIQVKDLFDAECTCGERFTVSPREASSNAFVPRVTMAVYGGSIDARAHGT